jgi:hypothetical protein
MIGKTILHDRSIGNVTDASDRPQFNIKICLHRPLGALSIASFRLRCGSRGGGAIYDRADS